MNMKCPECKGSFKKAVGLATHMRRSHGMNSDGTKRTEIVVRQTHKQNGANHGELYAYIAAKLEDTIHLVALEHDLPERQFAFGFAKYISRT